MIVTLTTDFGLADAYVGAMKGVILTHAPQATVVDICHHIAPGDIASAGFVLASAWRYFPAGAVHVAVVDPGVGTARRPLAIAAQGSFFVGPDNGLFSFLFDDDANVEAVHLNRPAFWLPTVSATFHGRDIFAPVAARLASGTPLGLLGDLLTSAQIVRNPSPLAVRLGATATGQVVYVDHFGNLITNIPGEWLAAGAGAVVEIAGWRVTPVRRTYAEVTVGELLALVGSTGYVEVAMRGGSAASALPAGVGEQVRVAGI